MQFNSARDVLHRSGRDFAACPGWVYGGLLHSFAGVLMKKISLYARKRMHKPEPDKLAPLRLLDIARPYEPGEMVEEHVATKAAYIRLRDGDGTEDDFDRVSMILNVGLLRSEQIDPLLVETMQRGQMAMVRMKDRYLRGLRFGCDAQGLQDIPEAIDAYETVMDASSPLQMKLAIQGAYARISGGQLLEIAA